MNSSAALNPTIFKKVLRKNLVFPIVVIFLMTTTLVGLLQYFTSVIGWVNHTNQVLLQSSTAESLVFDSAWAERGFLLTGREEYLVPYHQGIEGWSSALGDLKNLVSDNPPQLAKVSKIGELFESWKQFSTSLIEIKQKNGDYLSLVKLGRGREILGKVKAAFKDFSDSENQLWRIRNERAQRTATFVMMAIGILGFLVGAILIVSGRKQLTNLSGVYGAALEQQRLQNEDLKIREWIKSGVTNLLTEIRTENNLDLLSSRALNFICTYLNCHVGAFFVSDDGQNYQLTSSYASASNWNPLHQNFRLGEGLLGQAAAENKMHYLKEVPERYMNVESSLGSTAPKEIIIAPLISNDGKVKGIIEVGSLYGFSSSQFEFLKMITESLGVCVHSSQDRNRIESLLGRTQKQAEDLQTQQEELRASNEELEEQARALQESQGRLQNQQEELSQINTQLEEQTQVLEDQKENLNLRNQELNSLKSNLENKAEQLESANRYKSEFLANMSHELRTPLNSTLILLKILIENQKQNLDPEQINYLQTIDSSSHDLLNLINDILDLSKVEAGMLDLESEEIKLSQIIGNLKNTFQPIANSKSLEFIIDEKVESSASIVSDRLRVEQILRNLLSNAIKFTERGKITLKTFSEISRMGESQIGFSVTDTGIGISEDKIEMIFEPFKQADGTINRKFGGTGLGLSISRDLAKLLGGRLEVKSKLGEGSTFILHLPAAIEFEKKKADAPVASSLSEVVKKKETKKVGFSFFDDREFLDPKARTLLIVDDDPAFVKIVYDLAHTSQFQCIVAGTADDAVALARQYSPSGIVLDLVLPDHNGLSVLDLLKSDPRTRHIPVHVISALDRKKSVLEMGAINFIQKPIEADRLRLLLKQLEPRAETKVLIVEDEPIQGEQIAKLIRAEDIQATIVRSGEEALQELQKQTYNCMITDLKLPGMSGEDLLQKLAREKLATSIAIIVYTARQLSRSEEEKLRKFSRAIVVKGSNSMERLLNEVTLFIHKVEKELPPDRQQMLQNFRNREKVLEGRKILLADDDVRNLFALTSALEQKGARVITAKTGKEAVTKLQEEVDTDLVLMDIMMPEMDGYQATREIRKFKNFQGLPVIVVTAKAMQDDHDRALEAGANDYLAKPIELEKLLSLIRVWISK
ncbi:MAG: response regulator [Deltaproteobacteria bacterium]|nr:response regulator [Deltaproteobacteria bacterium]